MKVANIIINNLSGSTYDCRILYRGGLLRGESRLMRSHAIELALAKSGSGHTLSHASLRLHNARQ